MYPSTPHFVLLKQSELLQSLFEYIQIQIYQAQHIQAKGTRWIQCLKIFLQLKTVQVFRLYNFSVYVDLISSFLFVWNQITDWQFCDSLFGCIWLLWSIFENMTTFVSVSVFYILSVLFYVATFFLVACCIVLRTQSTIHDNQNFWIR